MKIIKGTHRNDCPSSFWVTGTADAPKIGNIYTTRDKATRFTDDEVLTILLNFGDRYYFEVFAI